MGTNRIAIIDRNKCMPDKCCKECHNFCPRVRAGDEETVIVRGKFAEISEDLCIGCGICVKKCPKKAIMVINLAHELDEPVHQYGKNAFRLYNLPIPLKGKVTGLLGANGIGKTTALKILSGQIMPNLGKFDNPPDWDEIILRFRGTELQNYLSDLKEKKVRAIYKPQQVDLIPKMYKGKVTDIIKDERGLMAEMAKKLEIEHILDRKLTELSGGELQRVAILAAILREGDVYYFDESSSFLDIRHRLIVASVIRELALADKAVMIVEHDLATLDFLTDMIHIVYGHSSVYGVISTLYSSRRGVNTYLSGYIKDSNVRFRPDELSFMAKGQIFKGKDRALDSPAIGVRFDRFGLEVDDGTLYAGEIVGVFGANALGKTTFAKVLAGEIKPNKGKIDKKIKIAYKPQYLKGDYDGTVAELLAKSCDDYGTSKFKMEIVKPFELEVLLDNYVGELSGGELQRVAVAICLAKDVEFYLIDEPSAYLDVEERVKLAKIIRRFIEVNKKTCMVIDHDMMLLNYISDRAIIFLGESGVSGHAKAPVTLHKGMNIFLKSLGITFRREQETGRPRANKLGSQHDDMQKRKGEYYCA
ncbi:MAG: ribosome biogenesis/translation initiation ATPase RLI [archaeon]